MDTTEISNRTIRLIDDLKAVCHQFGMGNDGNEYKVILVGDALMDMYELMEKRYDYRTSEAKWSGLDQIKRFREHYDHLIWLNPEEPPRWGGYWGESYGYIARAVDMYPLTVDGLERGMKKLLVNR